MDNRHVNNHLLAHVSASTTALKILQARGHHHD